MEPLKHNFYSDLSAQEGNSGEAEDFLNELTNPSPLRRIPGSQLRPLVAQIESSITRINSSSAIPQWGSRVIALNIEAKAAVSLFASPKDTQRKEVVQPDKTEASIKQRQLSFGKIVREGLQQAEREEKIGEMVELELLINVAKVLNYIPEQLILAGVELGKKVCRLNPSLKEKCREAVDALKTLPRKVVASLSEEQRENIKSLLQNRADNIAQIAEDREKRLGIPKETTVNYFNNLPHGVLGHLTLTLNLGIANRIVKLSEAPSKNLAQEGAKVSIEASKRFTLPPQNFVDVNLGIYNEVRFILPGHERLSHQIVDLSQRVQASGEAALEMVASWMNEVEQLSFLGKKQVLIGKFVHIFSEDVPNFQHVRKTFADRVFRKIDPGLITDRPLWLLEREINESISSYAPRIKPDFFNANGYVPRIKPHFFHATHEEGLEGILKSKKIEVRQDRRLKGAFVSTIPELFFGRFVLVFNRSIAWLSKLKNARIPKDGVPCYWAGFSKPIPVTPETLECIIIDGGLPHVEGFHHAFEKKVFDWTGRYIPVYSYRVLEDYLSARNVVFGVQVPATWLCE